MSKEEFRKELKEKLEEYFTLLEEIKKHNVKIEKLKEKIE